MPVGERFPQFSDRNLRGNFFGAFDDGMAASYLPAIAARVNSDRAYEAYGWLGAVPVMREWVGGRQLKQPNEFNWTIWNKKYEDSIQLPIDDIRRDKTGQFDIFAASLGQRAAENPILLLSDLLIAAESSACFDGQYFFDSDHVEGNSGTNDNDISYDIATNTAPTDEEMEKAILNAIKQIYKLKDDQGQPVNQTAKQFALVAPIAFMDSVLAAVSNKVMTSGHQNVLTSATDFKITPYFDPRLSWTTKFALFRTDHPVKPFIHQVEVDNQIDSLVGKSEYAIMNDAYFFGVKRIEGIGYGDYKKAVLTTFT